MENLDNVMALYLEGLPLEDIQGQLGMEYDEFYDVLDEIEELCS